MMAHAIQKNWNLVFQLASNRTQQAELVEMGFNDNEHGSWHTNHTKTIEERDQEDYDPDYCYDPQGRNYVVHGVAAQALLLALAIFSEGGIVACRKHPQLALALQAIALGLFGNRKPVR